MRTAIAMEAGARARSWSMLVKCIRVHFSANQINKNALENVPETVSLWMCVCVCLMYVPKIKRISHNSNGCFGYRFDVHKRFPKPIFIRKQK